MKYSQFNAIIPFENQFALFNSFTQRVIFLLPELKELLEAAIHEGVSNLEEHHPTFYNYLVKKEFLIEDSVNEIEKVKEVSRRVDENETEFLLTVNPTMNCNFKCWYCYETHVKDSKMNRSAIDRTNKLIDKVLENPKIQLFSIALFGGEPLLYFDRAIVPILDHYIDKARARKVRPDIGFTTNGYLIDKDFVEYFKTKSVSPSFQITLDGYREEHDKVRYVNSKTGSYEKIVENIKLLVNNQYHVRVRINYTEVNIHNAGNILDDFKDLSQEVKEEYIMFDFHRVWQDNDGADVTHLVRGINQKMREYGFIVQNQSTQNALRNSCYADKRNSVTINYNGDIFKCTARDFTKVKREGFIDQDGNLIWENNSLERRMNAKFKNKPCLSCKILPLCNGGCSQAALENEGQDYCVYKGIESAKDDVIKEQILKIRTDYEKSKERTLTEAIA